MRQYKVSLPKHSELAVEEVMKQSTSMGGIILESLGQRQRSEDHYKHPALKISHTCL